MVLAYFSDNSNSISDGYYFGMDDAISTAYQIGITDAATGTNVSNVEVVYHVNHTHETYCYPIASYSGPYRSNPDMTYDNGVTHSGNKASYVCTICGGSFSGTSHGSMTDAERDGLSSFYAHLSGGRCTRKGYQCGKDAGEQEVTDVSILGAGDSVVSATITY